MTRKYNLFVETNETFIPFKVENTHQELPSGTYRAEFDLDKQQVFFNKLSLKCDNIIDLPSGEYDLVLSNMKNFLKDSTKKAYKDNGFIYKRSVLLHGRPGTGKTILVNRVVQEALKNNAVVLFNPEPQFLEMYFQALDATAPDKLTLVVLEEFDSMVKEGSGSEEALLSILDGEVQKNNVMYLATTNYIDRIPVRIQRPGRFSNIIEVNYPNKQARESYLRSKGVNTDLVSSWVSKTDGFSIDELKETVLSVHCLNESLDSVVNRMKDLKQRGLQAEEKKQKEKDEVPPWLRYGSSDSIIRRF